ncbi:MAG: response regulator [Candidatus Heimdallarchaeota archaeon]|nr:response regulator [Candidatus Heimdallarchaeota archaeon]
MTSILLGSDFMFNEELGSRLRGAGYSVQAFNNLHELEERMDNDVQLVIIDLEKKDLGGINTIQIIVKKHIPVLALTQHRSTDLAKSALENGAQKVIFNSQASKNIERYVKEILEND